MYNSINNESKGASGVSYCPRCGAYIPIGETACPACGYDPEAEERAREEAKRREEEQKAQRERREQEAKEAARREEAERERARREAEARKTNYRTGSASTGKTNYRTGSAGAQQSYTRQSSQQGEWVPPWSQTAKSSHVGQSSGYYDARSSAYRAAASDSVSHQRLSVLSYLGFLFVIPYLKRRGDSFARFHASQGLTLFLLEAALSCCSGILGGLITLAGTFFVLYCIFRGIRSVLAGRMDKLPLIGGIDLLK